MALPLSVVTVKLDLPTGPGTFSLGNLHARVCETYEIAGASVATDQQKTACGDVAGSVAFHKLDAAHVDADITFGATPASDAPSLTGQAHVQVENFEQVETCPDLGSVPQFGLQ
jgi:hypothetical protein